jgi:tetratricopeptide (TPR) repeat protein
MARRSNLHKHLYKPSLVGTLALVFFAIVLLFFVDTFLARMERSESRIEAERSYQEGQRLLKQGFSDRAADQFRAAISSSRDNSDYQLALAQALMAAGRFSDAEASLADPLARDGTAGAPNLAMARVLTKEGRIDEALSYYHRAIYGQWKQNALGNRVQVRFELIDLLIARNQTRGLLAELLPLQGEAPGDSATKKKLAGLFVSAGSPARGAELFRDVLKGDSQDPDAYAGLGDAAFAQGNYRTALAYYQAALRLRFADGKTVPDDDHARQRAEICTQVLALDPTQRGLSTDEQYRRSVKLLDLLLTDVRPCLGAGTPVSAQLLDAAAKALKQRVSVSLQSAALESNLDLSEELWQLRKTECPATPPSTTASSATPSSTTPSLTTTMDEPLSLVLNRLAQ